MRFAVLALLSSAALPLFAMPPASAVTVNVGGTFYDVTALTTSYKDSPGEFMTLFANGRMPWWGNSAVAADFAMQTFDSLGPGTDPLFGPIFAYQVDPMTDVVSGVYQLLSDINVQDVVNSAKTATLKYAIATPMVPAPLPLVGAAAGYAWSRRLRQRVRRLGDEPAKHHRL